MRILFEKDIEHCDFLEIILSQEEILMVGDKGIVHEFECGLEKNKSINIFIRKEGNLCL